MNLILIDGRLYEMGGRDSERWTIALSSDAGGAE